MQTWQSIGLSFKPCPSQQLFLKNIKYNTHAIITHRLYIFLCGLYCKVVCNAEWLVFHDSFFFQLKTDSKRIFLYKWPLYDLFWPFFCHMCVFFHKTKVLTVILRFLMGLNFDWVKSYGLRCSLRPHAISVNFQKIATDK